MAADHVASRSSGAVAPPVLLLPAHVPLAGVIDLPAGEQSGVPVGLVERGMVPWWFDVGGAEPHFFVYGDSESGKTTFLRTRLTSLAARRIDEARVVCSRRVATSACTWCWRGAYRAPRR